MAATILYREDREVPLAPLISLYEAVQWSSAKRGEILRQALKASHALVTAWDGDLLVGLGNTISDGFLVVYYPHLLVLPAYQGHGIGTEILRRLRSKYEGLHQHVLLADGRATDFYRKCGFTRAGKTEPMWIYAGNDH